MTRACLALLRGDLAAAWSFNPFCIVLVAVALGAALPASELRQWLCAAAERVAPVAVGLAVCWWVQRLGWLA